MLVMNHPISHTLYTDGTIPTLRERLSELDLSFDDDEPGSMLSRVPADLEKEVLATLAKSNELSKQQTDYQKQVVAAITNTPPNPPPPEYLDGTLAWLGGDKTVWRYSKQASKWRKVAGPA